MIVGLTTQQNRNPHDVSSLKRKANQNDDGSAKKKSRTTKKGKKYNGRKYFEPFPKLVSLYSFKDLPDELLELVIQYLSNDDLNAQLHEFSHKHRWFVIKKRRLKHPLFIKTWLKSSHFCPNCHHRFRAKSVFCLRKKCQGIKHDRGKIYGRIMKEIGDQVFHEQIHQEWLILRELPKNINDEMKLAITYGLRGIGLKKRNKPHGISSERMKDYISNEEYEYGYDKIRRIE